jgi:hypothetical protein
MAVQERRAWFLCDRCGCAGCRGVRRDDKGPADAALTGKTVLEAYWKGSPTETPQASNGPRH